MFETIHYELKETVAYISLNRPDTLNAFTAQMNHEIRTAVKQASIDTTVRCIVLRGEGRAFCSGQDLSVIDEDMKLGDILTDHYGPMVQQIHSCEKPIIAAVKGAAAGAGFSLALAADFRVMAENSFFMNAFIHVGLIPDSGNLYYLKRLVGDAKALEISILGQRIKPGEAKQLGIATAIYSNDTFEDEVHTFAQQIGQLPTKAIGLIKRNMKAAEHLKFEDFLTYEAQSQSIAGATDDHQEGMKAFTEKRQPQFSGQ
ncbi:2-(1,2-epoxy-1,2-dihydrophenyl)acetyl-CoA isomerase [Lysinibacillus fusiformis]|nr:2-(1,2-epoxy-1,2-dihydrophenyl)acetyl-CoA isomerase [Lysinibacillus fusiformis]